MICHYQMHQREQQLIMQSCSIYKYMRCHKEIKEYSESPQLRVTYTFIKESWKEYLIFKVSHDLDIDFVKFKNIYFPLYAKYGDWRNRPDACEYYWFIPLIPIIYIWDKIVWLWWKPAKILYKL